MNAQSLEFLTSYCTFNDPNLVWILTGISRNKDNPSNPDFYRRFVLTKSEDILQCYNEIHALSTLAPGIYRMYISLNARDITRTFFNFQKVIANIGWELVCGRGHDMANRIASLWKTELAQNSCRGTKRVLIDLDETSDQTLNEIINFIREIPTEVVCVRPTVSGWHIVISACDTRGLVGKFGNKIDIQKDSMVFVESWSVLS